MSLGVEAGVRTVVPFDDQGLQPFLRGAHMVRHDGDGVVEPDDLTHALDRLGGRIIHALHAAAEDRRLGKRGDLHAGRPGVDAVHRRPVDLAGCVQALGRRADQLEILRPLQRHAFGERHAGGLGGKLAIAGLPAGRRMNHLAALRAARCRVDFPALCRRPYEHGPGDGAGLAHLLPRTAHGVRIAGRLDAQQRICVELFVGRRVLQLHLLQVHLELFGDQHRHGGVVALAHLDIGHGQDDLSVAARCGRRRWARSCRRRRPGRRHWRTAG